MENLNPIEHAAMLAGQELEIEIKDGAFIMRPSDAGVMLLAWLQSAQKESDQAWDSVDEMTDKLENLRDENAVLREALESASDKLEFAGLENDAKDLRKLLWKVVGIDDEGNEIEFEWLDSDYEED
jgi:cell shape-determining protein MreC